MCHDRQSTCARLDEDIAERFEQRQMQEDIGGAIEGGHIAGGQADAPEPVGQQLVCQGLPFCAQGAVPGHHQHRIVHLGHGANTIENALGFDKRTHHQDDRAIQRQSQLLANGGTGVEAFQIHAIGNQRTIIF